VLPYDLGPPNAALAEQEVLNRNAQVVRPVEQHRVSLSQALSNVFGHPATQGRFDVTTCELFLQRFHGCDTELLVNAKHALGIETRMSANVGKLWTGPIPQLLEFSEGAGLHDFANGATDGLANSCIFGKIRIIADKFVEALRERANLGGGTLVRLTLYGFSLCARSSCARLAKRSAISALLKTLSGNDALG
jgi:hypothetical protein